MRSDLASRLLVKSVTLVVSSISVWRKTASWLLGIRHASSRAELASKGIMSATSITNRHSSASWVQTQRAWMPCDWSMRTPCSVVTSWNRQMPSRLTRRQNLRASRRGYLFRRRRGPLRGPRIETQFVLCDWPCMGTQTRGWLLGAALSCLSLAVWISCRPRLAQRALARCFPGPSARVRR